MSRRRPTWVVRWNEDRTEGVIIRMVDWPGHPPAPCVEGKVRRSLQLMSVALVPWRETPQYWKRVLRNHLRISSSSGEFERLMEWASSSLLA